MRFDVLGPLEVAAPDEIALDRRSHRRLLAILLLGAERPLDSDLLIDRFWGEDPPATARAALQTHLSQLRRRLGDRIIVTSSTGYVLDLTDHSTDLAEFDGNAERARTAAASGAWEDVVGSTRQALRLWRGTPFQELQDDAYARPEIARLEELRAELIELQGEALLALGRIEEALPNLERSAAEFPYRERMWEQLMLARARAGRTVEALSAYHESRRLFDEMGLEPGPALRDLEERILREDPALVPPRVRHNLPPRRTTFIGRESELTDVRAALTDHRIVTLTGVGGSGKTRLAVETAEALLPTFPDGTWMVDLATIDDPELVAVQVAMALGLRAERASVLGALMDSLRSRTVLVLLDNCEHLLASCARLAETLLAAGPEVRVLATSREALGVEGEVVYQVHPLPTPPGDEAPDVLAAYDSVRLFADRAGLAARGFAITAENATTVSSICRRLDGLPLAIELAAARMSALAPEDVADRLDNRFRLLARSQPTVPPRHQTLEATVAWSYDHLTEAQRTLFVRLAVFSGPFGLDMAEAICPDLALSRDDVAPLLSDLVQRSLVGTFDTPRGRRYRLLETLRAYARAKLERARAAAQVWQRHRDYFLRSAEERIPGLEAAAWFESVEPQHEDMEAALSWSLRAGDAREAALLASALGQFWRHVGHPRRAVTRLRETLDRLDLHAEPEREADLRCVLSDALFEAADGDAAFAEAERAYALVSAQPPSPEKLVALWTYAGLFLLVVHRDPTQAVAPAREMLAVALALGDRRAEVAAHHALGHALGWSGSIDEGLEHTRRALAIAQELGSPQLILTSYASFMTPLMLHPEARREEPRRITEEILSQFGQDERWDEYIPWTWICYVFLETGEWDRAEEVIDRWEHRHLEGFALSILYHARGCLRWMQGRLADAEADMAAADTPDLAQRMYHDVFNLRADVAADAGQLEQVRNIVARYMAAGVHAAEEFMKTAVLCALVRAEVDAALGRGGAPHDDHAQRARDAFGQMQEILRRYPPPTGGSVQLETPATHLLTAEAELSRLANPRPELWRALIEQASYAYWKLYARWRLAESLVATGRRTSAGRELHAAGDEAGRLGASLLRAQIAATAAQAGLRVPA